MCAVCGQEEERVEECQDSKEIPTLRGVDYLGVNWVELQFTGRNKTVPSMCFQYEKNGACQVCGNTDSWCRLHVVILTWGLEEVFESCILV